MKRSFSCVLVCLISVMAIILPSCNNAGAIAVSFVQATTQAIDNGQTFNITAVIKNDSSKKGVTWSLTGPGMLSNKTTTSVTYNAPPLGAVARFAAQDPPLTAMVTATSVADTKKSATVTFTLTPPPSMSNQTLAAGVEGTAYSQPVVETGGAGTLTWTIIAQPGPQPAGLNISSSTGVISGTPTGPNGTFTFTAKVTDSNAGAGGSQSAQAQVSITINLPPAPKISPAGTALASGTEGTAYSQQFTVSNGLANFTWTVVGGDANLPAGLHSAQSGTGNNTFTISGTPTGPNKTTNFQIKVTDSSNPTQSDTQSYSITINLPTPPKISPAGSALPAGTEGTAYSQQFTVSGGLANFTWTVVGGDTSLPAGLHSSQSPGGATFTISGTPTGPNTTTNFQIKVTDSSNPTQSDTQNYSITIALPLAPKISPAGSALPAGMEGTAYSQQFTVSNGLANFTWTVVGGDTSLPAGLHSAQSGTGNNTSTISGTPTGPTGTTNFQIKVTDSSNPTQSDTQNYSILVNPPPPPVISPASGALPSGNVGTPINQQFTVSGGLGPTFTWSESGALPNGLSFNASNSTGTTVAITGTPTTAQNNVPFSVTVMDSSNPKQSITNNYTLTINPPAPFMITTATLQNGNFNQAYNATIGATGGVAPYTFSLDASSSPLPSGLNFSSSNNQGVISGTPTTAGTFSNIIVDAHDNQTTPATDQKTYTLTITAPVLVFMPANNSSLPTGTQNQVYAGVTISATGGVQPYTFTQDATSQLPTGLTFTPGTNQATISGTPTQSGTFNVVVDFQDAEHPPVMQKLMYTLTINTGTVASCPLPLGGAENLLNGTYSGLFNAWQDKNSMIFEAAAAFAANGSGTVTGGEADAGDTTSTNPPTRRTMTPGCYSLSSTDHRGKMIWNFGAGNTVTFSIAVTADGSFGRLIEFDDTTGTTGSRGSGFFRKQVGGPFSANQFTGGYAFANIGSDSNGNRVGVIGRFTAGGGNLQITNGFVDVAVASTTGPPTEFTDLAVTGSFTAPDNFGRGTLTLTITAVNLTLHFAYYIDSTGEILVQSTDVADTAGHALLNGRTIAQSGTSFTTSSLTGNAVFSLTGADPSASHAFTDIAVGQFSSPNGDSVVTTTIDEISNSMVVNNDATIPGGAFALTANEQGMGTLTIGSDGTARPFSIVMTSQNTGFMLEGTTTSPAHNILFGGFENQTIPAAPSGLFVGGTVLPGTTNVGDEVGTFTVSATAVNGTEDRSRTTGLDSNHAVMLNVAGPDSHGRLMITPSGQTGVVPGWIVSTSRVITAAGSGGGGANVVLIFLDQ